MFFIDEVATFSFVFTDENLIDELTYGVSFCPEEEESCEDASAFVSGALNGETGEYVLTVTPTSLTEVGEYSIAIWVIDDNACGDASTLSANQAFTLYVIAENKAP